MQEHGAGSSLNRRHLEIAATALAVVVADQLTKWWALRALDDRDIDLIWTLRFHLTFNTGSAFSFASGSGGLLAVLGLVVVVALVVAGRGVTTRPGAVGLGLVLGGAIGNLLDRAFREGDGFLGGAVVDFVDLQWWPVFNIADMGITIGAVVVALGAWREPEPVPAEPGAPDPRPRVRP